MASSITHHPLLGRRPTRSGPDVGVLPDKSELRLTCGRLHEACGNARWTFAMWLAGQMQGTVLWVSPSWSPYRMNPDGMVEWADPGRFVFVEAARADDLLWTLEEALRSGAVPLVIGDLTGLPGLTQVRRMHLAAQTGGQDGQHVPLGLILTPDEGGAQGVESRWSLQADHATRPGQWHLRRLRARTAPVADWRVSRQTAGKPLTVQTPTTPVC